MGTGIIATALFSYLWVLWHVHCRHSIHDYYIDETIKFPSWFSSTTITMYWTACFYMAFCSIYNRLYFLEQFLASQQHWAEGTIFPIYPLPYICTASSTLTWPVREVSFLSDHLHSAAAMAAAASTAESSRGLLAHTPSHPVLRYILLKGTRRQWRVKKPSLQTQTPLLVPHPTGNYWFLWLLVPHPQCTI